MDEERPQAGEALTVSVETTDTGTEASRQARVQTLSVLGCGGDAQVPALTPNNDQQPGIVVQQTPFP